MSNSGAKRLIKVHLLVKRNFDVVTMHGIAIKKLIDLAEAM
jgi:hypothetical protein